MRGLKKLVAKPGIYFRDYLLKRFPVPSLSRSVDQIPPAPLALLYELSLFSQAQRYDLSLLDERARSVRELEELFFAVSAVCKPDLFIEAGAKDARTSRRARGHLPDARIVACEANPHTFERFASNPENQLLGVQYIHRALSAVNGPVTFHVRDWNGKPSADGQGSLLPIIGTSTKSHPVTVEASRMDSLFSATTFDQCAVWMDVEGASQQVLTGAAGILGKFCALFIEVQDNADRGDGQWLSHDIANYLLEHGMVPIARDFQSRYQYNVLYVSERVAKNSKVRLLLANHLGREKSGFNEEALLAAT